MELTNNLSEKALYDYKVVKRAITGDEQAYAELFKRYKDSVYFMILKMVNNRTDAEDLMFEAFEKAFTSLNYYSPQFAFSTWLFKIASNNTIDFIRKKKAKIVSLDKDDINPDDRGYINIGAGFRNGPSVTRSLRYPVPPLPGPSVATGAVRLRNKSRFARSSGPRPPCRIPT